MTPMDADYELLESLCVHRRHLRINSSGILVRTLVEIREKSPELSAFPASFLVHLDRLLLVELEIAFESPFVDLAAEEGILDGTVGLMRM